MVTGTAMPRDEDESWVDPGDPAIEASADRVLASTGAVDPQVFAAIDKHVQEIAWVDRPDQMEDPKLGFLLQHWQTLAAKRDGIPDRRDIDVLDLVPAIGNLMVLEAERDGFDAIYRVYGTGVADLAGRDWTGFRVSEMNRITRTPAALLYRTCYRAVFRRSAPLYTEHASPRWVGACSWRRLILPLSDGDTRCARFLVGNVPVGDKLMSSTDIADQQQRIRGS